MISKLYVIIIYSIYANARVSHELMNYLIVLRIDIYRQLSVTIVASFKTNNNNWYCSVLCAYDK